VKENLRLKLYQKYNRSLDQRGIQLYWKLLRNVVRANFQDHEQFDDLLNACVKEDFDRLWVLAETMSEQQYQTAWMHFRASQLFALIKKLPIRINVIDPEQVAREKFLANDSRISEVTQEKLLLCSESLHKARSLISYVLDVEPDLNEILGNCAFGPGASLGIHGNATNVLRKISAQKWTVTPACAPLAYAAIMGIPCIADSLFPKNEDNGMICYDYSEARSTFYKKVELVNHKKVSFVPKTAKTHRVIAVEPLLNGFVQKGIDTTMRRLLLSKVKIDLNDQTRNQKMALMGSLEDCEDPYVTIDLTSASDSITPALVNELFPPGWVQLFNSARATKTVISGEEVTLNQYVSMGNGFCFPLQTLIFSSLAHACGAKIGDFSVYGDDIIVRQSVSGSLLELLGMCGFIPNMKKTFLSGPFRESCGKDYFRGFDTRPFYLKDFIRKLEDVFKFCNGIQSSDFVRTFFRNVPMKFFGTPDELLFVTLDKSATDSAISVDLDVYLASRLTTFSRKLFGFKEYRLRFKPVADNLKTPYFRYALAYQALIGSPSRDPFTVRYSSSPKIDEVYVSV